MHVTETSFLVQDMKEAVLQIYDNRSNLSNTLKDTRTIVGKLERLLGICLQLIFIFLYLAIFNVCPVSNRCKLCCMHNMRLSDTLMPC